MRVVLPFSGGIDCTAAMFLLAENGHDVFPVTLDYGQKAAYEIEAAARIARFLGVSISKQILLSEFPACARIFADVNIPTYKESLIQPEALVVPGLYWQIIAHSIQYAEVKHCEAICLPFSPASSQFYPESNDVGWQISSLMIGHNSSRPMKAILPFTKTTKLTLLKMLIGAGAPYWMTYSCLNDINGCKLCDKCYTRESLFNHLRKDSPQHMR